MAIVLGDNQYGKAETRVVRIYRDTERHEIRDLNVSTALRGDFGATHPECADDKERGVRASERYALVLARHFTDDVESVTRARIDVDEYRWERITVGGTGHAHAFIRAGQEIRRAGGVSDT